VLTLLDILDIAHHWLYYGSLDRVFKKKKEATSLTE